MPPRARARGKPDSHDLVPVPGDAATAYVLSRLPPVEDDVPLIVLCGVTDHAETRAALGRRKKTFLMTLAQVGHVDMPNEYDLVVTPVVTSYLIKLDACIMDTPLRAALFARDARTAALLVFDAQIPAARASDAVRIALFTDPSPERRVPLLDLGPPSPHAKSLLTRPEASLMLL
jgi:hypothetical protein